MDLSQDALSTGSTLLNLACTDNPKCGYIRGHYHYLVGDSVSGKTWLSLTCFAESQLNEHFKDYELHFDNPEDGALMDIEKFFGKKVADKMIQHESETVQEFYRRLYDLLVVEKKKIIYVLDSQDALDDSSDQKKFREQKKAAAEGEKEKGTYGMNKAKYHSQNIRWVKSNLRKTGSILIIIGQTRDNTDLYSFEKRTRSGGKALKFYASVEIWTAPGKPILKKIREKKRVVGVNVIAEVKKNRVTGKVGKARAAVIPIYHSYGIDDVGSMTDFLIAEGVFRKKKLEGKNQYISSDLDFRGTRGEIIRHIESNGLEETVQDIVTRIWNEIEEECQLVERKRRYG